MNEKAKILFFCMIFVATGAAAQKSTSKSTAATAFFIGKQPFSAITKTPFQIQPVTLHQPLQPVFYKSPLTFSVINPAFYVQHWGFFCQQEWQLEKFTRLPFKFRLGSVQQCDKMEGKPNTSY